MPGALAQQLALAKNAADLGEAERAAIATEVRRWADALGPDRLVAQARTLSGAG